MVAEELAILVRKEISIGMYKPLVINNECSYSLFQLADDTIFMGESGWDNVWAIKSILRAFKMLSGLKINMGKSKLYVCGVENHFLEVATSFLCCKIDKTPFSFLGITVGGNHRHIAFWNPMINSIKSRLLS
ncbi:uncharacterized protein LOC131598228 [Vicia villosa]|uniref:uncharacterized protein LOC131598228 n=1 Tax=Vicia villosa TaxID=3911 RepID=UPI00273C1863|nr:uncharacterized protein LOC131598228 [Vicia villosa]